MRNKFLLSIFVLVAAIGNVWSQTIVEDNVLENRWGFKGGINMSTIDFESGSNSTSLETTVGIVAGITLEHPFSPKWFLHSGVELSMKGFEYASSSSLKSTAIYLQVPVTVGYKFNIGKQWKLEPRLGVFLAYGIAGNTSASASGDSGSVSTFDGKILNPLDAGSIFGIFFDNRRVVIGIHGEMGVIEANGENFKVSGAVAHTSNVSLTVGFPF